MSDAERIRELNIVQITAHSHPMCMRQEAEVLTPNRHESVRANGPVFRFVLQKGNGGEPAGRFEACGMKRLCKRTCEIAFTRRPRSTRALCLPSLRRPLAAELFLSSVVPSLEYHPPQAARPLSFLPVVEIDTLFPDGPKKPIELARTRGQSVHFARTTFSR